MSTGTDPKGELHVVSRDVPPPSTLNDSIVALTAGAAVVLGLVFSVGLLLGGPLPLYGGALALGLLSLAVSVRRYFTDRFPDVEATEPREVPVPDHEDRPLSDVEVVGPRRSFLKRFLLAAAGLFGITLLTPIASLGPAPQGTLRRTAWGDGDRLVTTAGEPVRPSDVAVGGVVTVWPQGAIGQERSSVVLLRPDRALEPPTVLEWVVGREVGEAVVAYSKVCTHAGCPVALYRERDEALFCPCHQSTFDPIHGAVPTFGPAARALPQLPMGVDAEGFLVALGDFQAPVGPALPRR